jgi:DNA modification methylase
VTPYYQDDAVTIYHADCLAILDPLYGDGLRADLLVTDPPYFAPAQHYVQARGTELARSYSDLSILRHAFTAQAAVLWSTLTPAASLYVFCDGQSYPFVFQAFYSWGRVRPLIWDKGTSFNGYTWRHQTELIAWIERADAERIPTGDGDILRERAVPVDDRTHPAEKPLPLVKRLIEKHTPSMVLDPFMGSGTTLRAAKDLGRKAIGIEMEERYCEIAAKRCAQEVLALETPA